MATKRSVYSSKTEDDGSITIMVDEVTKYNFSEPLGKTLVALEKRNVSNPDSTEIEDMAYLMSLLEVEGLTEDHFLSLPLGGFKFIANELNAFFRTELD